MASSFSLACALVRIPTSSLRRRPSPWPTSGRALVFGFGWFALQVLQGTSGLFAPDMAGGIAWWAHIGGFGFGAVFAIFVCGSDIGRTVTARHWAMPARGRMMRTRGPWDISSIAGYDAKLSITLDREKR